MPTAYKAVRMDGSKVFRAGEARDFQVDTDHTDEHGSFAYRDRANACSLALSKSKTYGERCRVVELAYDEEDVAAAAGSTVKLRLARVVREVPWDEILEQAPPKRRCEWDFLQAA